ncbi:MAG: fluoride efflux transporter CrcB [Pelagibacterales bacterium]|nr:fluoride efflux transporter CrcB [Pelagibacterales bacterium]
MNLFLIAIGGAIGSVLRYLSLDFIVRILHSTQNAITKFPWGTLFVNVLGSMIAGILYYFIIRNFDSFDPKLKNFLLVGFLGGFTTFSSFSLDFFRLATSGSHLQAFLYAASSCVLAISALFAGFYITKIVCA